MIHKDTNFQWCKVYRVFISAWHWKCIINVKVQLWNTRSERKRAHTCSWVGAKWVTHIGENREEETTDYTRDSFFSDVTHEHGHMGPNAPWDELKGMGQYTRARFRHKTRNSNCFLILALCPYCLVPSLVMFLNLALLHYIHHSGLAWEWPCSEVRSVV